MAAAPAPVAPPGLRLHLLGGFHVAVDGRLVEPSVWRLRHAATLVKLLALAPGHHLHRERLARQLWPASPPSAAAGSLNYALHVARRALRPAPAAPAGRWLTWQGDLLALGSTEAVWTDVAAFETAAAIAHRAGDRAMTARVVIDLAGLSAVAGQPGRAARLWGAMEGWRARATAAHETDRGYATRYEHDLAAARTALGEAAFAATWAAGAALTLEEAVAEALDTADG